MNLNKSDKSDKVSNDNIEAAAALGLKPPSEEPRIAEMTPMSFDEGYKTKILIVRHGESIGNATHTFLGHTNLDLSERGYRQAARTDELLADIKIDAVYTSDLIRAYNTALPHARRRGLTVIPQKELREMYAGEWENKKIEYILERYGDDFQLGWRAKFGVYAIPGGERPEDATERLYSAILKIAKENEGKTVLVGCHAAVIRLFFGRIRGIDPSELGQAFFYPTNASVNVVYFDGEKLIPGEYSHDAHLADI